MHIYLSTDVGPRIIACEEVRVCGSGSDLHMPGALSLRAASADLFGGDGAAQRGSSAAERVSAQASTQ